jgi:hypothetical protein
MASDPEHPETTRRSRYRYCFTSKHHGGGSSEDAQWNIPPEDEFFIFDTADFLEVCESDETYYGVLPAGGQLTDVGTWAQQVAEFPKASPGSPWHGYPIWAVNDEAPPNRSSAKLRPSKAVFLKMETVRLITKQQRKRLLKGKHA